MFFYVFYSFTVLTEVGLDGAEAERRSLNMRGARDEAEQTAEGDTRRHATQRNATLKAIKLYR